MKAKVTLQVNLHLQIELNCSNPYCTSLSDVRSKAINDALSRIKNLIEPEEAKNITAGKPVVVAITLTD